MQGIMEWAFNGHGVRDFRYIVKFIARPVMAAFYTIGLDGDLCDPKVYSTSHA